MLEDLEFEILHVMHKHMDLNIVGFRAWIGTSNEGEMFDRYRQLMMRPEFTAQVADSITYIEAEGIGSKGSYVLKHAVEGWLAAKDERRYISNGAAIVAAMILGYRPVRAYGSPNCKFVHPQRVERPAARRVRGAV